MTMSKNKRNIIRVKEGNEMKKLYFLLIPLLLLLLIACGSVQSDYYEVHVIVVEDTLFYYIDPSDGKDTFSANQMGSCETLLVYLYDAEEDVEFSYDQYFTTIQDRYVETNLKNDKLYILSSTEIDNLIYEFLVNKPN